MTTLIDIGINTTRTITQSDVDVCLTYGYTGSGSPKNNITFNYGLNNISIAWIYGSTINFNGNNTAKLYTNSNQYGTTINVGGNYNNLTLHYGGGRYGNESDQKKTVNGNVYVKANSCGNKFTTKNGGWQFNLASNTRLLDFINESTDFNTIVFSDDSTMGCYGAFKITNFKTNASVDLMKAGSSLEVSGERGFILLHDDNQNLTLNSAQYVNLWGGIKNTTVNTVSGTTINVLDCSFLNTVKNKGTGSININFGSSGRGLIDVWGKNFIAYSMTKGGAYSVAGYATQYNNTIRLQGDASTLTVQDSTGAVQLFGANQTVDVAASNGALDIYIDGSATDATFNLKNGATSSTRITNNKTVQTTVKFNTSGYAVLDGKFVVNGFNDAAWVDLVGVSSSLTAGGGYGTIYSRGVSQNLTLNSAQAVYLCEDTQNTTVNTVSGSAIRVLQRSFLNTVDKSGTGSLTVDFTQSCGQALIDLKGQNFVATSMSNGGQYSVLNGASFGTQANVNVRLQGTNSTLTVRSSTGGNIQMWGASQTVTVEASNGAVNINSYKSGATVNLQNGADKGTRITNNTTEQTTVNFNTSGYAVLDGKFVVNGFNNAAWVDLVGVSSSLTAGGGYGTIYSRGENQSINLTTGKWVYLCEDTLNTTVDTVSNSAIFVKERSFLNTVKKSGTESQTVDLAGSSGQALIDLDGTNFNVIGMSNGGAYNVARNASYGTQYGNTVRLIKDNSSATVNGTGGTVSMQDKSQTLTTNGNMKINVAADSLGASITDTGGASTIDIGGRAFLTTIVNSGTKGDTINFSEGTGLVYITGKNFTITGMSADKSYWAKEASYGIQKGAGINMQGVASSATLSNGSGSVYMWGDSQTVTLNQKQYVCVTKDLKKNKITDVNGGSKVDINANTFEVSVDGQGATATDVYFTGGGGYAELKGNITLYGSSFAGSYTNEYGVSFGLGARCHMEGDGTRVKANYATGNIVMVADNQFLELYLDPDKVTSETKLNGAKVDINKGFKNVTVVSSGYVGVITTVNFKGDGSVHLFGNYMNIDLDAGTTADISCNNSSIRIGKNSSVTVYGQNNIVSFDDYVSGSTSGMLHSPTYLPNSVDYASINPTSNLFNNKWTIATNDKGEGAFTSSKSTYSPNATDGSVNSAALSTYNQKVMAVTSDAFSSLRTYLTDKGNNVWNSFLTSYWQTNLLDSYIHRMNASVVFNPNAMSTGTYSSNDLSGFVNWYHNNFAGGYNFSSEVNTAGGKVLQQIYKNALYIQNANSSGITTKVSSVISDVNSLFTTYSEVIVASQKDANEAVADSDSNSIASYLNTVYVKLIDQNAKTGLITNAMGLLKKDINALNNITLSVTTASSSADAPYADYALNGIGDTSQYVGSVYYNGTTYNSFVAAIDAANIDLLTAGDNLVKKLDAGISKVVSIMDAERKAKQKTTLQKVLGVMGTAFNIAQNFAFGSSYFFDLTNIGELSRELRISAQLIGLIGNTITETKNSLDYESILKTSKNKDNHGNMDTYQYDLTDQLADMKKFGDGIVNEKVLEASNSFYTNYKKLLMDISRENKTYDIISNTALKFVDGGPYESKLAGDSEVNKIMRGSPFDLVYNNFDGTVAGSLAYNLEGTDTAGNYDHFHDIDLGIKGYLFTAIHVRQELSKSNYNGQKIIDYARCYVEVVGYNPLS